VFGSENLHMANSHMGIANVYYSQGRYEEALVQYQKVLEVFLAVYVQKHPLVAETKEHGHGLRQPGPLRKSVRILSKIARYYD